MNIEIIRERVQRGNYLIKSHAVQHALKEGFDRQHMVEAILKGRVIETLDMVTLEIIEGTLPPWDLAAFLSGTSTAKARRRISLLISALFASSAVNQAFFQVSQHFSTAFPGL